MPVLMIKHKIIIGFSLLLVILLINATLSVFTLSRTQKTVTSVIQKDQPVVLAAHRFNGYLAQASGALSNYLLTKNDSQRQNYQNSIFLAGEELGQLKELLATSPDEGFAGAIQTLTQGLEKFQAYEPRMLELAKEPLKNETALAFATEFINPPASQVLASYSAMISSENEEDLSDERREWALLMHEIRYQFQKLVSAVRIYLSQPTAGALENVQAAHEIINGLAGRVDDHQALYTFEQEEEVRAAKQAMQLYSQSLIKMIEINEGDKRRMDVYLLDQEILPLLSGIQHEIDQLVQSRAQSMQDYSQELLDEVDTGLAVQSSLAVIGLVLGVLVAVVISRMVTAPLNQTVTALQDVAQGNGDLTYRLEVKTRDEFGELAAAFNKFTIKLQSLMINVTESCNQLIESAEKMGSETANTQSGVKNQNLQLDQITQAIDSMVTKVKNVAGHTSEAAKLAEQTNQDALEGRVIVSKSLESSNQLAQDVEQAANVINALEEDVVLISGVLDVIGGIAEQTNLLALNAAIEAARAGEQGRGFAVVADEVRTLASRTQQSTSEIHRMIQRLQSGSLKAVEVMNAGKLKALEGLDHARQAGDSLNKISTAAEGMQGMNREIANATRSQGDASNQISQNVVAINELALHNSKSADVMAQASQQVNDLVLQLKSVIGQFKV